MDNSLVIESSMWSTLIGFVLGWFALRRLSGVPRSESNSTNDDVSIIIPARNEAAVIGDLVRSLRAQHPRWQIIVVDDHSSDTTWAEAAEAGAEVFTSGALPPGWVGKSWACHNGAGCARGRVLLFLDADVAPTAEVLDDVVRELQRSGGIVSVQPMHNVESAYERLSAVPNLLAVMGVADDASFLRPGSGCFGPCIALRRADYDQLGGHATVRSAVTDDIALGQEADRAGMNLSRLAGDTRLTYRMYPDGLRSLLEGWTKNLAVGAEITPLGRGLLIAAWMTALFSVTLQLLWTATGSIEPAWSTLILYALMAVQFHVLASRVGRFGIGASLAFPLLAAGFACIFVAAQIKSRILGTVTWRGRSISTRGDSADRPISAHGDGATA